MNDAEKEANTPKEKEVFRAINSLYLIAPESVVDSVKEIVINAINKKQEEIERLKEENGILQLELAGQTEILMKKLSEAEAEVYRLNNSTHCSYCEFEVPLDVDSSVISEHIRTCENHPIRDYEKQIQSLTARNKELELILYNHSDDVIRNCYRMIKELESKLAVAREALKKISECSGSTGIYEAREKALAELGENP